MSNLAKQEYKKLTQLEHLLLRPDTYIGSVTSVDADYYLYENELKKVIKKTVKCFNPGLYNVIEEINVNAFDNFNRIIQKNEEIKKQNKALEKSKKTKKLNVVSEIKINIKDNYEISIYNNGEGIDIYEMDDVYIPQMVFCELLSSSNYDDSKSRIVGGRNGIGAKATNAYSKKFIIETIDYGRKLKYTQICENNLSIIHKPTIEKYTGKPYTKITFIPDYNRFGVDKLSNDMISLLNKRAYDLIAFSNGEIKVYFNNKKLEIEDFNGYISLFIGDTPRITYLEHNRWKIGLCVNNNSNKLEHVSSVNGINTRNGGSHVNYIVNQIVKVLKTNFDKKNKSDIKENLIKSTLMVFVFATIENPSFDSQTKETLTTNITKFGSKCEIPEKLILKLIDLGIYDKIFKLYEFYNNTALNKISGKKKNKIFIEKLEDARYAGTKRSKECKLFLTEGDSAKSMVLSGLSPEGRDFHGVFPLKGKLLNTRGQGKEKQIADNAEICKILKIVGLKFEDEEEEANFDIIDSLRYGQIIIMTDQDVDGSHIKGLIINFLCRWPALLKNNNFIVTFLTPIIKVFKGNKESIKFYNIPDYDKWLVTHNNGKGYTVKYYKGLGTSSSKEAKEYFKEFKTMDFFLKDTCFNSIDMAFNPKRADDRKTWILSHSSENLLDYKDKNISYTDFINKELILFSIYDCVRSIPSLFDGLKPSQRKVLYTFNKKNIVNSIKVSQVVGIISSFTAYHHGEMSLTGTVINMAQNYVGDNNINLLTPEGQFGTRYCGGKDCAQPRYIFTKKESITKHIFNELDDNILEYEEDDGKLIEPRFYLPIVPMVLINGTEGIGTGWSSGIPKFNPLDIIKNIRLLLNNQEPFEMTPWYRGFKGTITKIKDNSWLTKSCYNIDSSNSIVITELPIGLWTEKFKSILDSYMNNKKNVILKDYKNNSTDSKINFTLTFHNNVMNDLLIEKDKCGITKFELLFRLTSKISCVEKLTSWNETKLLKFKVINDILKTYYEMRLIYYTKRKEYILNKLKNDSILLSTKVKFIKDIRNNKLNMKNDESVVIEYLAKNKFHKKLNHKMVEFTDKEGTYDFLLSMQMRSITENNIKKLEEDLKKFKEEITILEKKTDKGLWLTDLENFETEYNKHLKAFYKLNDFDEKDFKKKSKRKLIIKNPHNVTDS